MNELTLKALLLDTIMYLNHGHHMAPNYKAAKKAFCRAIGQPENIPAKQLLHGIGLVYRDNGKEAEFWRVIDKFNLSDLFA